MSKDSQPKDQRDKDKDKRKRALAWLAELRKRVQTFCGAVKRTNSLIAEAQDAAKDIREFLQDDAVRSVLPLSAGPLLESAAERLEQAESFLDRAAEYGEIPADICKQTFEALDYAEAALTGNPPWHKLWNAAKKLLPQKLRNLVGGLTITAIVGAGGLILILNIPSSPEVSGVYILASPSSMAIGDEGDISVYVEDNEGNDITDQVTLSWSSSESTFVDVSSDGHVIALAPGTSQITVSAGDQSAVTDVTVTGGIVPTATLPDLTVSFASVPIENCTSGSCTISVDVDVQNIGRGDAGSTVVAATTSASGSGFVDVPPLRGGTSTTVTVITDPGAACYTPQCTVIISVDGGDDISESDESNNRAESLFGG